MQNNAKANEITLKGLGTMTSLLHFCWSLFNIFLHRPI